MKYVLDWHAYRPAKTFLSADPLRTLNHSDFSLHGDFDLLRDNLMLIPCGKCIDCRLKRSSEWADRLCLEYKSALEHGKTAYFITLTYSDDELVYNHEHVPTLVPGHVSQFMKNLRSKLGDYRFFACGEYGSHTMRPHYHLLLFGPELPDLVCYKKSETGFLYNSDVVSNVWKKGHVVIADFTWNTASYVARYTAKQDHDFSENWYSENFLQKPFLRMSNRPGIGYQYLLDHPNLFDYSSITLFDGRKCQIPNYFFRKLKDSDLSKYNDLKQSRLQFSLDFFKQSKYYNIDFGHSLEVKNLSLVNRLKCLKGGDFV